MFATESRISSTGSSIRVTEPCPLPPYTGDSGEQALDSNSPVAVKPSGLHRVLPCSEPSLASATYTPQLHALAQDLWAPTSLCFSASTQALSCTLNAPFLFSLCSQASSPAWSQCPPFYDILPVPTLYINSALLCSP